MRLPHDQNLKPAPNGPAQRHPVARHYLEASPAAGSFRTELAARRGHTLAGMAIQRMDNVAVVVDDLDACIASCSLSMASMTPARLRAHGAELLGEVARCESIFLLCYLRGPAGIIAALAEQTG